MGLRLYLASVAGDIVAMMTALAEGAEVNSSVAEEEGRTALIGAAVGVRSLLKCPISPVLHVPSRHYKLDAVILSSTCRGPCWPASSCCRTVQMSTTETFEGAALCMLLLPLDTPGNYTATLTHSQRAPPR